MGDLIDFEQKKTKKKLKEIAHAKGIVYEIYLSVVKYVYKYADSEMTNTSEYLTTEASLAALYKGDRDRFAATLKELANYWELDPPPQKEVPYNREFDAFQTIGDLCEFIEQKVNKEKKL
ncbi:hypothetical protein [Sediminibacillus albus]|uniref:Uncharacterized protein n=1 Tax=Sediminibacillus albus TaxID=407036 RepID=A0A1G8WF05_9BACI|nr:hypothetical protein [Sediminibacillus albus]SDJ76110.1 hypothetical protein SAMN05216243_0711 [Sediminibacillus albus]